MGFRKGDRVVVVYPNGHKEVGTYTPAPPGRNHDRVVFDNNRGQQSVWPGTVVEPADKHKE